MLIDKVHDELQFVQTLEVRNLWLVSRFNEGLESSFYQLRNSSAQHHLLPKQVRLDLLLEGRFHDPYARQPNAFRHGKRDPLRVATGILLDSEQAWYSRALLIHPAKYGPWGLWRDHYNVDILRRHYLLEMDVEAVAETERFALFHMGSDLLAKSTGLIFIRDKNVDDVRPLCRLRYVADLKTVLHGLLVALVLYAPDYNPATRIPQVVGLRLPLIPVSDYRYSSVLERAYVRVLIIINLCHTITSSSYFPRYKNLTRAGHFLYL